MISLRRAILLAALIAVTSHAGAGPLRERLAAHLEARRASQAVLALPAGVKLVRDVSYGADKAQRFDVYFPAAAVKAPVIFMVHGGGWKRGDKSMDRVVENKVAYWGARGFVVISSNYRMLPEADPLTQARDIASAIGAAQSRAGEWGGAPDKFILMGHSAGAHLVTLLSSSASLRGALRWLGTVSLDSAAYDVELAMQQRHMALYDEAFGADPAYWRSVSPYAQLTHAAQPLLAVCSAPRADACAQARRYADRAAELGMRVEVLPQQLSHREINESLGTEGAYTAAVDRFIGTLLPAPM
jgi:arylformamidase